MLTKVRFTVVGTPINYDNPFNVSLVSTDLALQGQPYLIAGDDLSLRFQLRNISGPIDLTGSLIIFTIKKKVKDSTAQFTRRSDTNITGSSPARLQIQIDADQTTETGDTGRGWFTVVFGREQADSDALYKIAGLKYYDIRVKLASGVTDTMVRGLIDITKPITTTVA